MIVLSLAFPARAESGPETLKRARDAFEYGDFARTVELLKDVPDASGVLSESERIDAYRMLGLSYFYLHRPADADNALFGLLKQNPDYQLDPFYVPPDAVAFFDDVKKRNEQYLAPIRDRRNERLRAQAEEERQRAEADRRRREEAQKPPLVIQREVAQNSQLVAFMPFGLGQFQNGSPKLGVFFLASEAASGLASVAAYGLVEALRSPDQKFSSNVYDLALKANTVKWVSAVAFYALWAAGIVEANVDFVPSRVVSEAALPSAAPAGPLARPTAPEAAPKALDVPPESPKRVPPTPSLVPVPMPKTEQIVAPSPAVPHADTQPENSAGAASDAPRRDPE